MKTRLWAAVLGILIAMPRAAAGGEAGPSKDPQWNSKHVERLTKKLNLTTDQQVLIKALLEQKKKRMEEVRKELTLIRDQTAAQIKSLLTNEQIIKYEKIEKKMKKHQEGD